MVLILNNINVFKISAVAVILGLTNQLIDLTVAKYEAIIIGIWLGFYLVMEIILEIVKFCASEGSYKKSTLKCLSKTLRSFLKLSFQV